MKIVFLCQGVKGCTESVGNVLLESFSDKAFNKFGCLVAFASSSGINGMSEAIEKSKQHIKQFRVVVGIDQKGTSKEALEALLKLDIGTSIYYTCSPLTFHPKVYLFEGNVKNRIIVGSSNLTKQGLFQNMEASLIVDFTIPDEEGEEFLKQAYAYLGPFFDAKFPNVQKLTSGLIEQLFEVRIIPDEIEREKAQESKSFVQKGREETEKLETVKSLFPTVEIPKLPDDFKKTVPIRKKKKVKVVTVTQDPWSIKGRLRWKKTKLPPSDVLYAKAGTNPTGGLRLTQAKYKVKGKVIDQTTYFRRDVFGKLTWKQARTVPYVETAEAKCYVKILGTDKGLHRFVLRHKPSGEAGQGNYTTSLSWGKFGEEITKNDLREKDFYLYAPPKGQNEPFYIEIKVSHTVANLFA